jgi:transcriptional regulator with XRE-family HTH domain
MSREGESDFTMQNSKKEIALRLKQARESLEMTQEEFGEAIGLPGFAVRDIEAGKKILSPDIAKKIEGIYFINFRWLLTGEEEMNVPPRRYIGDEIPEQSEEVSLLLNEANTYIFRDKSLTAAKAAILIYNAPEEFRLNLLLAIERELFFLRGHAEQEKRLADLEKTVEELKAKAG